MELGFALAGIGDAVPSDHERELREWLAAGKHGEMQYLARHIALRIDPAAMVPGARSILAVADRYPAAESPGAADDSIAPGDGQARGKIARYARGDDYHKVMRKRLASLAAELKAQHPEHEFRACVDTAPVLEREFAQRAGVGAMGKNTMIIERGVGSYLLLGEIITTMPLEPSTPSEPDPCGTCTRCIDACPTDAIAPWSIDATRCISYLTIEHRGLIDPQFHAAMDEWIFGCDICQEVCPHNQLTERTRAANVNPAYQPRRSSFDLLEVLNWTELSRQAAFVKSSMKRAKLNMMKRNALIAAGNVLRKQEHSVLHARIHQIAMDMDEDQLVRDTAHQVLCAIAGATAGDTCKAATET